MTSTDITVRPAGGNELELLKEQVRLIQQTDFVPKALRGKPHAILACILYGREMGLGPMKSLQEIDMIDGSPTESAAIVAAKIRAAGHRLWREEHRDGDTVTGITAHGERSDGTRDSFTFTLSMAARANLLNKTNWKTYPEAMLWARACTQLARFLFSDVFLGAVYTREEIGASDTDENGAAIVEGQVWDAAETAQEPGSDVTSPAPAPASFGTTGARGREATEAEIEAVERDLSAASQAQHAKLAVIIHELEAADTPLPEIPDEEIKVESWEDYSRWHAFQEWGVESRSQLSKGEMSRLIEHMQSMRVPFA